MGLQYLIWIGFDRMHACTKVHVYVHVWLRLGNQLLFVSDRFRSLDAPDFVSTLDRNPTDPNRPLLRSHYSLRYSVESRLSSPFTTLCSILFRHSGMNGFLVCGPAAGLGCVFLFSGVRAALNYKGLSCRRWASSGLKTELFWEAFMCVLCC